MGDIHLPDGGRLVDRQDDAFPPALANRIFPDTLQGCLRRVIALVEDDPDLRCILFTGDLTSRGDLADYGECVDLFTRALRTLVPQICDPNKLHAVPGNHDIDRSLCTPDSTDLEVKFAPLAAAWEAAGLPILAVKGVRSSRIESLNHEKGELLVFSLNSCYGCGEKRSLPEEVQEQLYALLKEKARDMDEGAFALVGEQLDTPAFLADDVDDLTERLSSLEATCLPIVVSHHNLLPQSTPRLAVYTELINGGMMRSRLVNSPTPVVYCHGHIHDDPVEVVMAPEEDGVQNPLVLVSAPEFRKGFNVLEFVFTGEGLPLGCTVMPYRTRSDGEVRENVTQREGIRFRSLADYLRFQEDTFVALLRKLKSTTRARFPRVLAMAREDRRDISEQDLAAELRQAHWFGLVRILNIDVVPMHWQIRRMIP